MSQPSYSTSPGPTGQYVYTPKVTGQVAITRQEISQYDSTRVGVNLFSNGLAIDPDSINATVYQRVSFQPSDDPLGTATSIPSGNVLKEAAGVYSFILSPTFTNYLSLISVKWIYTISGTQFTYWDYYEVLEPMPTYSSLTDDEKGVVRLVTEMFSDLYDSVDGGPHLKEEFQTHFGTETIARCMELATHRINNTSQPFTTYNVGFGDGTRFPSKYYSILVMATYLEVVRHLIRSYTEYATMQGNSGVAFVDRSNYADRWRAVLKDEQDDFMMAVRSFKRSLLGLGGGALLVSGGIYGTAPYFKGGFQSAAQRAGRFYPTSYVRVLP